MSPPSFHFCSSLGSPLICLLLPTSESTKNLSDEKRKEIKEAVNVNTEVKYVLENQDEIKQNKRGERDSKLKNSVAVASHLSRHVCWVFLFSH